MPTKKTKKLGSTEPKKRVVKKAYVVEVTAHDETQTFKVNDILEALQAYVPPVPLKTAVTFKVTKGDKVVDREINVREARHTFVSPTALVLLAKNLSLRVG